MEFLWSAVQWQYHIGMGRLFGISYKFDSCPRSLEMPASLPSLRNAMPHRCRESCIYVHTCAEVRVIGSLLALKAMAHPPRAALLGSVVSLRFVSLSTSELLPND